VSFKAPYLSKDELRHRANRFLAEHHPGRAIPVPIEFIVESRFGVDIVPIPGLQAEFDVVAFITKDMCEIRVDEYIYLHRPNRYRFSLAHELAHRILHPDLWSAIAFQDVQSWKAVIQESLPEREYGFIEFHANFFAGLVLVPEPELRSELVRCIALTREHGLDPSDEATGAIDIIESHLARRFEVSRDVVHRRIEADGLWDEVV
jgi:hypothetical protein